MILSLVSKDSLILKKKCERVPEHVLKSSEFYFFLKELEEVMYEKGGIGIAAPQVGKPLCVVLVGNPYLYPANRKAVIALINPEVIKYSGQINNYSEGCLSDPGERQETSRYESVEVEWVNQFSFCRTRAVFSGYHAAIVQHELDHLRGICIWDHEM